LLAVGNHGQNAEIEVIVDHRLTNIQNICAVLVEYPGDSAGNTRLVFSGNIDQ